MDDDDSPAGRVVALIEQLAPDGRAFDLVIASAIILADRLSDTDEDTECLLSAMAAALLAAAAPVEQVH